MAENVLQALMAMENAPQAKRGPLGDLLQGFVPNTAMGLQDLYERAKQESTSAAMGGDYNPQPVMELATGMIGGGTPFAQRGALGIFGGRGANTANKEMLSQAETMAKGGATPDEIWNATGWFKGPDQMWRFEIPDTQSRLGHYLRDQVVAGKETRAGAGGAFWHPKLYEAYPQLRELMVHGNVSGMAQGTSYGGNVGLSPTLPRHKMESTMLHELQHEVQKIEGFAPGGNPAAMERARIPNPAYAKWQKAAKEEPDLRQFLDLRDSQKYHVETMDSNQLWREQYAPKLAELETKLTEQRVGGIGTIAGTRKLTEATDQLFADFKEATKGKFPTIEEADRLGDALKTKGIPLQPPNTALDPYDAYRHLAGEVEARNVQSRLLSGRSDPSFLSHVPPWYSQDIPTSEQIMRTPWGQYDVVRGQ